jgi:hypothetical protein
MSMSQVAGERRSRKVDSEMASLHGNENQARAQESGARQHGDSFWTNSNKGDFRAVIDCLLPPPARAADLVALFDNRATYAAIQNWRSGRNAPAWAIELVCQKLDRRLKEAYQKLARAPQWLSKADRRGAAGAKALAAWRERKARERDEKEKAARAALSQSQD